MSDPKYNTYAGELRFDDDNIVDVNLQPDTENITVRLNGEEVTGGSELPEVDSGDNGKVLTVVSGEWAAATPATPPAELPAVTSSDNGDVLTVVEGAWAKADPEVRIKYFDVELTYDDQEDAVSINCLTTISDLQSFIANGLRPMAKVHWTGNLEYSFFDLASVGSGVITFEQFAVDDTNGVSRYYITFSYDGEVSTTTFDYTTYPTSPQ